jgi:hypothetical protein
MVENLNFLNCLDIPTNFIKILKQDMHQSDDMFGWQGLASLTCINETDDIYDIDIRYAWAEKIFQQNLVDYGWSEGILVDKKGGKKPYRHKLIIYLCEPVTKLNKKQKLETTLDHHLIGCYWKTLSHLYLLLPFEHPFKNQIYGNQKIKFEELSLVNYEPAIQNLEDSQIKTTSRLPVKTGRKGEGGLRTKGSYKTSTEYTPLISIVTVVFNGDKFIEQTIQSVINQSYTNLEYIIIDGGSTDKTVDIIKKYEAEIDYWVSEADLGVFDAMNKGISCVFGDFVNFMNVGDIFFKNTLIESLHFEKSQNSICGKNVFFSNNRISGIIPVKMLVNSIPHQALFMQRSDFEHYRFNIAYKYTADAELWQRFNPVKCTIKSENINVSISRFGGISTSAKYLIPRMKEHLVFEKNKFRVLLRFIPKIILSIFLKNEIMEFLYFLKFRKMKNLRE